MSEYKLHYDRDLIDVEDSIWCSQCGDQLFYGNVYFIFEDRIYCPYCTESNGIIQDAIEVDPTL